MILEFFYVIQLSPFPGTLQAVYFVSLDINTSSNEYLYSKLPSAHSVLLQIVKSSAQTNVITHSILPLTEEMINYLLDCHFVRGVRAHMVAGCHH